MILNAHLPTTLVKAVDDLKHGEIVALPTETVYGLAADATNGKAVAKVFAAKGRPTFNPLICHVSSVEMAKSFAEFNGIETNLLAHFWPGPLTIVASRKSGSRLHELVTAGLDTVAVRMPIGLTRDIISELDRPIAAPSANRSGHISPTSAAAVSASLGPEVGLVVDGGECPIGIESTIVRVVGHTIHLLRPGGITIEQLEAATGLTVVMPSAGGSVVAPGQLKSHYAPAAKVRLNAISLEEGEAFLGFGSVHRSEQPAVFRNLSETGDLHEAAANLFRMLNELDQMNPEVIAVSPIPNEGLGVAINDRLARAAAPRDAVKNQMT